MAVLELAWLDELEDEAVGMLEVEPTEADDAVDPPEDVDVSPVLVPTDPALLPVGDDDCVSLLGSGLLLAVGLVVGGILMLELLVATDPLVREELVGEALDTDSLTELELLLL